MLIPYNTDAPLYHLPWATGGTIVANILVFVLQLIIPGLTETFLLQNGTFNPLQWLTCCYLHADPFHLIGNMLFLYIFGMIVEGKVGWWRFLLIYNGCGIVCSILVVIAMLFSDSPGALGASGAIFGLMAIALIWAPENEISFKFVYMLFLFPNVFSFDLSVMVTCFFYIGLNFVLAAFSMFQMSSEVIHLLGVLPGVATAFGMLILRRVNCDGYDLLSLWQGKWGQRQLTVEEENELAERRQEAARQKREELESGLAMVGHYIDKGHFAMAWKRFEPLTRSCPDLVLTESWLVKLINGLEKQSKQAKLYRKLLRYYIDHYESLKAPVTLKLARLILKQDEQPRKALRLLRALPEDSLLAAHRKALDQLTQLARQQIASGAIEVQTDDE